MFIAPVCVLKARALLLEKVFCAFKSWLEDYFVRGALLSLHHSQLRESGAHAHISSILSFPLVLVAAAGPIASKIVDLVASPS